MNFLACAQGVWEDDQNVWRRTWEGDQKMQQFKIGQKITISNDIEFTTLFSL